MSTTEREKMIFSKAVSIGWGKNQVTIADIQAFAASLLIVSFIAVSAIPQPGVIRERHIIHTPIKYKIIHHYNIKKVPIFIKKHLHYYKPQEDTHPYSETALDGTHDNQIYQEDKNQYAYPPVSYPHEQEEEYDEAEQSQEDENEDYDDYEYNQ